MVKQKMLMVIVMVLMMKAAEYYRDIANNAYTSNNVYDTVMDYIEAEASNGRYILNLNKIPVLFKFGDNVFVQLVDDLTKNGFKVIGNPRERDTNLCVLW